MCAASRQRAHDRGAAADVRAVADYDALRYAAFDHGRAERSGVEVHEAFVHDSGAGSQVSAEADTVGIGDAHAGGDDEVGHPRELVETVHGDWTAGEELGAGRLEVFGRAGAEGRPHDVGDMTEDAVEVDIVGSHDAVGQRVQTQVGIGRRGGTGVEIDRGRDDLGTGAASLIGAHQGVEAIVGGTGGGGRLGGVMGISRAQGGVPDGEDGVGVNRGESTCGNNAFCHASSLDGGAVLG